MASERSLPEPSLLHYLDAEARDTRYFESFMASLQDVCTRTFGQAATLSKISEIQALAHAVYLAVQLLPLSRFGTRPPMRTLGEEAVAIAPAPVPSVPQTVAYILLRCGAMAVFWQYIGTRLTPASAAAARGLGTLSDALVAAAFYSSVLRALSATALPAALPRILDRRVFVLLQGSAGPEAAVVEAIAPLLGLLHLFKAARIVYSGEVAGAPGLLRELTAMAFAALRQLFRRTSRATVSFESPRQSSTGSAPGSVPTAVASAGSCSLCLDPLPLQATTSTACGHLFCWGCVATLLVQHSATSCPVCRSPVALPELAVLTHFSPSRATSS